MSEQPGRLNESTNRNWGFAAPGCRPRPVGSMDERCTAEVDRRGQGELGRASLATGSWRERAAQRWRCSGSPPRSGWESSRWRSTRTGHSSRAGRSPASMPSGKESATPPSPRRRAAEANPGAAPACEPRGYPPARGSPAQAARPRLSRARSLRRRKPSSARTRTPRALLTTRPPARHRHRPSSLPPARPPHHRRTRLLRRRARPPSLPLNPRRHRPRCPPPATATSPAAAIPAGRRVAVVATAPAAATAPRAAATQPCRGSAPAHPGAVAQRRTRLRPALRRLRLPHHRGSPKSTKGEMAPSRRPRVRAGGGATDAVAIRAATRRVWRGPAESGSRLGPWPRRCAPCT